MKMDVGLSLPKVALAAIVAFALALLLLLAWIGGEDHYGNCLEKASLQHPVQIAGAPRSQLVEREREAAISGCSRWP